jgi:outer membrane protein insertion porin family
VGRIGGGAGATESLLADELQEEWRRLVERLASARGRAFGEQERIRLEAETTEWLLARGYPWARVRLEPQDTTNKTVDATLVLVPGPRARVDGIVFEGQERLGRRVLEREVPIEVGEWYDGRKVVKGQSELYELDLVTRALGGIVPGQPRDSVVTLQYRIEESRLRLLWGRVGWRSESGFAGEAHWTHRNFFGGARTFTASVVAESGWAALEQARGQNAGLSLTVRQPYLGHYQVSGTIGPFVRYRDDFRDRSVLYGVETAAIYRAGPLETATLQYEISRLQVERAFELLPISEIVSRGAFDFSPVFVQSVFRLQGMVGDVDDRLDPRSGFAVEPSVEATAPAALTDVEFFRVAVRAFAAARLGSRFGLSVRASAGRLFPYGQSDPEDAAALSRAIVGLRGVLFTAGGTADVRGWGAGLLGPKIPDLEIGPEGIVTADRYVPVGGLSRLTGSLELGLPAPLLSEPHRTFVFLDAGRVWSPGERFQPGDQQLALDPWAFGTGAGVQIGSPFGPIRLAVGYKLNPTTVDLLPPGDVARALATGGSLSSLSTDAFRRWHLHLTIGQAL